MEITVGKAASWIFGVLFILGGIGVLVDTPIGGIVMFLTGLFLIPNIREEISERFDIEFSRWVVVIIAVVDWELQER